MATKRWSNMKTLFALFMALVLSDSMIESVLSAKETQTRHLSINEGRTSIEVESKDDLSCTFVRPMTNEVLAMQWHTKKCHIIVDVPSLPTYVNVVVTNDTDHSSWYTLRTNTFLPLK